MNGSKNRKMIRDFFQVIIRTVILHKKALSFFLTRDIILERLQHLILKLQFKVKGVCRLQEVHDITRNATKEDVRSLSPQNLETQNEKKNEKFFKSNSKILILNF